MPCSKFVIIGLDCAAPRFIFGPDAFDLPNLRALMQRGCWGRLRSCDPPITVPAWACMMSGKDPGTLGVYGFRNRRDYSYEAMETANALAIREPRLWDILSRAGRKVVVVGVPQTYPVRPVNGWLTAGFLTPDVSADFTYPKSLKQELLREIGEYAIDVKDFRTDRKDWLLAQVYGLMENRFDTAQYLMRTRPWDFLMLVEMGLDRLHHGFWRFCDRDHPRHEPGNPYEHVFRDYYRRLDARIGQTVAMAGADTAVMVVSDHGAKAMVGGICVNQWLIDEGYLRLRTMPATPTRLEDCDVDWPNTAAWSSGGYYARLFLNVAGREPQGIVAPEEYARLVSELTAKITAMPAPDGSLLNNRVILPSQAYRHVHGVAPDLLVYFGDLQWRSVGLVGGASIYTQENDTGPDDANHDYDGIFIFADDRERGGQERADLHLLNVAPTVLEYMGLPVPDDMQAAALDLV
jgi:predicted AlkP superfamily phosphohydrolase/phosphomutase